MITREELTAMVAELIADEADRIEAKLRADMMEKIFGLRAPTWSLTPKGELFVDGRQVGDVRHVFKSVLAEIMDERLGTPKRESTDDGR